MLSRGPQAKPIPELTQGDLDRFRSMCQPTGWPEHCLIWDGATNQKGYGQFRIRGKTYATHRVAYAVEYGSDSMRQGLIVGHLCRNHKCVNPDHLKQMTPSENRNGPQPETQPGPRPGPMIMEGEYEDEFGDADVREIQMDMDALDLSLIHISEPTRPY